MWLSLNEKQDDSGEIVLLKPSAHDSPPNKVGMNANILKRGGEFMMMFYIPRADTNSTGFTLSLVCFHHIYRIK